MNFSGRVYEWREETFQDSELPCIEYRDPLMETTNETLQTWMHKLNVKVRVNARTMAEVREIQAQIDTEFGQDTTLGQWGLIIDRMSDETEAKHEEKKYFSSIVSYTIIFTTMAWDQYTQ